LAGFDEVRQNLVDGVFIEDAEIPVSMDIIFERFEFNAGLIWYVGELDGPEIRQACLWANGGIFWNFNGNAVSGILVGPGFQSRELGCQTAFGMLFGVGRIRLSLCGFHSEGELS